MQLRMIKSPRSSTTEEDTLLSNSIRNKANAQQELLTTNLIRCIAIAVIGSFMFGYNTGIISSALLKIEDDFSMNSSEKGLLVSIILIGAIIGALSGAFLVDRVGRKKTILITAIPYIIGPLIMAFSPTFYILYIGRFVTGLAVGSSSSCTPLYISELSPPSRRGSLGMLVQATVSSGILVSYIVGYGLLSAPYSWRFMLGVGVVPPVIQLLLGPSLVESPRWLLSKYRIADAEKSLKKIDPRFSQLEYKPLLHKVVTDIQESIQQQPSTDQGWSVLRQKKYRKVLIIGMGLNAFQQFSGVNVVIYYAATIFNKAGFSKSEASLMTAAIGVPQLIMVIFVLYLIDHWGRKPMLYTGLLGMLAGLSLLAFSFFDPHNIPFTHGAHPEDVHVGDVNRWFAVTGMLIFRVTFSMGLGPLPMMIASEIYPLIVRGKAISISATVNWLFNFGVSMSFLPLLHVLGASFTFLLYDLVTVICILFVFVVVPETKKKSLEELEKLLINE